MMDLNRKAANLLGIPPTDDPWLLLGVASGRLNTTAIRNGLRRRLAQLDAHPRGNSAKVMAVRSHLKEIAEKLIDTVTNEPQMTNKTSLELTPLDQAIIAALVSEGGWNKKSRSRLVSIAASYSITVGGLILILEAFAEAARSGSGPLSDKQRSKHSMNRSWTSLPSKPSTMSTVDTFISNVANKITPELSAPSPVTVVKLSVIFGFLTLTALILSLLVLLGDEAPLVSSEQNVQTQTQTASNNISPQFQSKLFKQYPTFAIDGVKQSMLSFADQGVEQIAILESLAISLRHSLEEGVPPVPSVFQDWSAAVKILGSGWIYLDSLTLESAKVNIVKVLLEAEAYPSYATELVKELDTAYPRLGEPLEIARSSWTSGVLASLRCDQRLSAEIRDSIKRSQFSEITTCDSAQARIQALGLIARRIFENTEFDERSLELWEAWMDVVSQTHSKTAGLDLQVRLVEIILTSDLDLLRDSNSRKVLGRLVQETDWVSSSLARDAICGLISSSELSASDAAILTYLLYASGNNSWFSESNIVGQTSSLAERREISARIHQDWPIDTSNVISVWNLSLPIGLDTTLVKDWRREANSLIRSNSSVSLKLTKLRLLNEAAVSIWEGRPDLAQVAMERSKYFKIDAQFNNAPSQLIADGTFSDRYKAAGNDRYKKQAAIFGLSNLEANDLGKRDAKQLAFLALVNNKSQLRDIATDVIIEKFSNGKNVAVALLGAFSRARTREQITKLVASLTDVILPDPQSEQWDSTARSAFVQHALTVGKQQLKELDYISNELASSFVSEYFLLNPGSLPFSRELTPNEAIELVVDSWIGVLPPHYLPKDTADFRLDGLLQRYLQAQLEYLSLMYAVESNWRGQPLIADTASLIELLHKKNSIVDQIVCIEMEISKHWMELFAEVLAEYDRRISP
jgi:hypothetical protein